MENERIKILLVEDDKVDRIAFERFVRDEKLPYDYAIAGSVSEIKRVLKSESFDVVVMDYMLGDETAFDLFGEVPGDVPIVIVTGAGNEEVAIRAMKAGAMDYLVKDPDRHYLRTLPITIDNAMKAKREERELRRYHEQLKEMVEEQTLQLKESNEQLSLEIQERKRAEEALRESEEKYHSMFENIQDVYYEVTLDGIIFEVSPSIEEVSRYKREEVIGKSLYDIYADPKKRDEFVKELSTLLFDNCKVGK
jgi:PAS domain-containing protein